MSQSVTNLGVASIVGDAEAGTGSGQTYTHTLDLPINIDLPIGSRLFVYGDDPVGSGLTFSIPSTTNSFGALLTGEGLSSVQKCTISDPILATDGRVIRCTYTGTKDFTFGVTSGAYLRNVAFGAIAVLLFTPPDPTRDANDADGGSSVYVPATDLVSSSGSGAGATRSYAAKKSASAWTAAKVGLVICWQQARDAYQNISDFPGGAASDPGPITMPSLITPTANGVNFTVAGTILAVSDETEHSVTISGPRTIWRWYGSKCQLSYAFLTVAGDQIVPALTLTQCELGDAFDNPQSGVGAQWGTYLWDNPEVDAIDFIRHPLSKELFSFYVHTDGTLKCDRYSTTENGTVAATTTLDASTDCRRPRVVATGDGVLRVLYQRTDTNYSYIVHSEDIGRSWKVPQQISGSNIYELSTWEWGTYMPNLRPLAVAPLYDEATHSWYLSLAIINSDDTYTWQTPQLITADADKTLGAIRQRVDGVWEFLFKKLSSGIRTFLRCELLMPDGSGTWT